MDQIQIELLYCRYGWDPEKIATTINKPITYVKRVIHENKWVPDLPDLPNLPTPVDALEENSSGQDSQAIAIQKLKDNEVYKQSVLAPLVAITEIALLGKLASAIEKIDPETELGSSTTLVNLTKAFKSLQQDSVVTKVVNDEADAKPGIAIQVITQIA